jgi:hypothetical protein
MTGKNRIKTYGTYLVEFKTAEGEALAISIARSEAGGDSALSRTNALWALRVGSFREDTASMCFPSGVLTNAISPP